MVQRAVIKAVKAALPKPRTSGIVIEWVTAADVFRTINWWTLPTITEALDELMHTGQCEAKSTTRGVAYRLAQPASTENDRTRG